MLLNDLLSRLPKDFPWADLIHYFHTIDSTNTRAKSMAAAGAPHGTLLIADSQTGGRGRMGRQFHSPSGVGIYLSVILRPHCPPSKLMHLTCATAVAMCDAVEASAGFRPGIKWTNDLVYRTRKLAGILTELSLDSKTGLIDYAVVGIGINCGQRSEDFPPEIRDIAGSLSMIAGKNIDRTQVLAAMLTSLLAMNQSLLTKKTAMMDAYRRDCVTLNREISIVRGDAIRHGTAVGIDDEGALVVRFPDGQLETVSSGEVSIRGMYGYV